MDNLTDEVSDPQSLVDPENPMFDVAGAPEILMPDDRTVNYVFPVEVVVIGAFTDADHRAIERRIWTAFGEAFSQQSA